MERDHGRFPAYRDADYQEIETDGRSVLGVTVLRGGVVMSAEYVTMGRGGKKGTVKNALTFPRLQVASGCVEDHGTVS